MPQFLNRQLGDLGYLRYLLAAMAIVLATAVIPCRLSADIVIGEVGRVTVEQPDVGTWHTVQLQRTYLNPVVIMGPASYNGAQPFTIRIRNALDDHFEFQVHEWAYLDGYHIPETIPYMVMEAGNHTLTNGARVEAGILPQVDHHWHIHAFTPAFPEVPVVLSQRMSANGGDPAVTRQREIAEGGFQVHIQEEERYRDGQDGFHVNEIVGYIAIQSGLSSEELPMEIDSTGATVSDEWSTLGFLQSYSDPIVIGAMQSYRGYDTASVRQRNVSSGSVEMFVQEETSFDAELKHAAENIGYAVFDRPGLIRAQEQIPATPPNIVMIYVDDMGYGDISAFGAADIATPHIDSLGATGVKFTSFYNSSSVCTASRAALMTGSYHARVSLFGALQPMDEQGLHPDEITIPEVLKAAQYATGMVGKWHLGDHQSMMPRAQGFDFFYGIPLSHDAGHKYEDGLPLYLNELVVDRDLDPALYTQRFTEQAVNFIDANSETPFFLYVAYPMPHVPLGVSPPFEGVSQRGLYGDVVQEIDSGVGAIISALEQWGIRNNTLIVFTSDNGPWLIYGNHAGDTGGLREGKGTEFEGGVRAPCVLSWPAQVNGPLVIDTPVTAMDLLPTFAAVAGAATPQDRVIDGSDVTSLFMSQPTSTFDPDRVIALYGHSSRELHAVVQGKWKMFFPHVSRKVETYGQDGEKGTYTDLTVSYSLYDLENDISESHNVISANVGVFIDLYNASTPIRTDLGEAAYDLPPGPDVRPAGTIPTE